MKKMSHIFMTSLIALTCSTSFAATLNKDSAAKIMTKSGCMTCHSVDNTKIGPSYRDVSARYNNPNAETLAYLKGEKPLDYLMKKVRTGTKMGATGNKHWIKSKEGKTYGMMTPNPVTRISDENLKDLVTYILSIK